MTTTTLNEKDTLGNVGTTQTTPESQKSLAMKIFEILSSTVACVFTWLMIAIAFSVLRVVVTSIFNFIFGL